MLVRLQEGRLAGAERETVLGHLDRCGECLEVVAALTAAARESGAATERPRWAAPLTLAAAAVLLVGLGVGAWMLLGRGTAPAEPTSRETLTALAARLRAAEPELLGDFQAPTAAELRETPAERGGFAVVSPAGKIAETRPRFAWQPVAGATGYDVAVVDEDGAALLTERATGASLAFPALRPELRPGAYVVEVTALAPVVITARRAFLVASPAERDRFERGLAAIAAHAEAHAATLAQAHLAWRRGWLERALSLARIAASQRPDDPEIRILLRHLASRVGLPPEGAPPR